MAKRTKFVDTGYALKFVVTGEYVDSDRQLVERLDEAQWCHSSYEASQFRDMVVYRGFPGNPQSYGHEDFEIVKFRSTREEI